MYTQAAKFSKRGASLAQTFKFPVVAQPMRLIGDTKKLEEKEKGDERLYFTKKDGKYQMSKL